MAGTQTDNLLLLDLTTGLARTTETGGTPDLINTSVDWAWTGGANVVIGGNLTVNGTMTTINTEEINVKDTYIYLNNGYTATSAITGGLVINVIASATADTVAATGFVAGVAATSNPTVVTTGSGTFGAGDVIQISGADDPSNDGIFEVLSHVGTLLTIRGIGTIATTQDWPQNQFTTDTTVAGTITVVTVSVICGTSTGDWLTATTSTTTALTYNTITTQGVVDLQEAYVQGNTITTSGGEGNVVIAGTELLLVTATGGIDLNTIFDADVTTFDVQMTGSNGFSIDGTAASNIGVAAGDLDIATTTSGNINVSSAAAVDIDATTALTVDTGDAADASANDMTFTAGSSTAGTAGGASIILTPGDGFTTGVAGFVNITSPADEDEILLQLESTGSGANAVAFFTGTSVPSGSVTADAGSIFLRDTGTGGEAYINTSTGSGTTWTLMAAGGGNSLQAAYAVGNTIVTNSTDGDLDVSGTEAISLDASAASNFTVASAGLTLSTTTSGTVAVSSAGILDLDATTTATLNTADAADASGNDITFTAASSTAGTADGASIILTPGDGFTTGAAGSVDILSPADEDEALLTLTNTGTSGDSMGFFVGDSDPSGSVTADAGSIFIRDTGTGAELYLNTSTGSGTTWTDVSAGAGVTLQSAYVGGNTIVMDTTNGDFDVSGSEAISLDSSAASNFTVASAPLTLSTTTAGNVDLVAADAVLIEAGDEAAIAGNIVTVNAGDGGGANDGGAINLNGGASGAGATGDGGAVTLDAGDAASTNGGGGNVVLSPGAGTGAGTSGFVNIIGPNAEGEELVRLTTAGIAGDSASFFVGDSDPDGSVTGLAGSLFMRDTGTGGELYINESTGSGTTWNQVVTSGAGGGLSLQTAYVGGNTIVMDSTNGDFDVSGSEAISLDSSAASNFSVASANLTLETTASGILAVQSAGTLDMDGVAVNINGTAASNYTVTGAGLALSTVTSGDLGVTAADAVNITAGSEGAAAGNVVNIDAGAGGGAFDGGAVTIDAGDSGAGATGDGGDALFTAGDALSTNGSGGAITLTSGAGTGSGAAGTHVIRGPNDEDEALLLLETVGTSGDSVNFFVGDSDPSGSVTGLAGSLFMRDTGTGGELYINESTASGTTWNQVVTSGAGGGLSLQTAYVGGNTIVMDSTNGDFDVSGSEAISLDASAASNFSVASANLTLSTTTSGDLLLVGAAEVDVTAATTFDVNAGTTVTVDTADLADASGNDITVTAGSSTAGTADGASIILTPGDGFTTGVAGSVDILSPADEDEALLNLTNTGTSGDSVQMFVGDSDPSGSITGLAGSLFMRDTGTGGELYINESTGSGTSWGQVVTSGAGGSLSLQTAYVGGNTIVTDSTNGDFDVSGSEAISLDASAASNFSVASANLTLETTTSGTVDINSAADIDMTFAGANATAMVIDDGTNTYMTFDSTTAEPAVEIEQFLDIVGSGAGVTLTAGEAIVAGDVLTLEVTTGDAVLADSNTGTSLDGLALGVAAFAAADTAPIKAYTVAGSLIPITFSAAPAAASNGSPVFVSATPGRATLTAPTGSGNVVYLLGILQGADGADTSPLVLFQPQFIAIRP